MANANALITLAQVMASERFGYHDFEKMTEEAQEWTYGQIIDGFGALMGDLDLTCAQALDCLIALENGKHKGYSSEHPEFMAKAFHDEMGHKMPAFPFDGHDHDETQYTMSFPEWLATGVEVDDLSKEVEGADEGQKGWYFMGANGYISGYLFSPCDKVSEYWTMLGNQQPSGTREEVAMHVYLWHLTEGGLTDINRFRR